jgi:hypothetical protein
MLMNLHEKFHLCWSRVTATQSPTNAPSFSDRGAELIGGLSPGGG